MDAMEEVQLGLYQQHMQPSIRHDLASQFAATNSALSSYFWHAVIDRDVYADVQQDPIQNFADGSPLRAVPIDVFPVIWTELAETTVVNGQPHTNVVPANGDMTSYYSPSGSLANFVLHVKLPTLYCDYFTLEKRYMKSMSEQRVLSMLDTDQPDCVVPNTAMDLDTFTSSNTNSANFNKNKLPLCKCWIEEIEQSCPVAITSAADSVIWDPNDVDENGVRRTRPDRRTFTAAGLTGLYGVGKPCAAPPSSWSYPAKVSSGPTAWSDLWNGIAKRRTLRTSPDVPSIYVGSYRQSTLNVSSTGAYDTQHNGKPMYLASIAHPWGATSSAADDKNPEVGPYKIASRFVKYALATMDPLMRDLSVRAYGYLTDDVVVDTQFAFDADSRLDYWMYTMQFAITQGKMEPVWNYGETPGGPTRTVVVAMPEIKAEPGVHLARPGWKATITNPEVYIPAAAMLPPGMVMPGDPSCWWGNCRYVFQCLFSFMYQCLFSFTYQCLFSFMYQCLFSFIRAPAHRVFTVCC